MKILFCGGGTGGHVTPALAIANYALENYPDTKVAFVGRKNGEENQAIIKQKHKLYEITIFGFQRKITLSNIKNLWKIMNALKESRKIIEDFSPDAVVGTGGYVCWPIIKVAQKKNIPTYIHESNAFPGLVTKLLAPRCKRVFLNFQGAEIYLKKRDNILYTGNPISKVFFEISRKEARFSLGIKNNEFLICSFGGSGGSKKLNEIIIGFIEKYSNKKRNVKHLHATGRKYYEEIIKNNPEFKSEKNGIIIKPYIDNMPTILRASDVVIARSGAMTITELAAAEACPILIPSPNVTGNHQYINAKNLVEKQAAILIEEANLSEELLEETVNKILNSKSLQTKLRKNITEFYNPKSERIICDEICGTK